MVSKNTTPSIIEFHFFLKLWIWNTIGTCTPTKKDDYVCVCPPAFTGIVCQSRLSIAIPPPILKTTTNPPGSLVKRPQKPHKPHKPHKHICDIIKPCLNNGTCTPTEGKRDDYTCVCPELYVGRVCQKRLVSTTFSSTTTTSESTTTTSTTTSSTTSTTSVPATELLTDLLTEATMTTTVVEIDGVKIDGSNHICDLINPCLNNGIGWHLYSWLFWKGIQFFE